MKDARILKMLAAILISVSGAVSASEAVPLSESQLDQVSAGVQFSTAGGTATAMYGTVRSWSQSGAVSWGNINITTASSTNLAIGTQTNATAYALSWF